jgi:hypothetical protein
MNFYPQQLAHYSGQYSVYKQKAKRISIIRLFVFIVAVVSIYLSFKNEGLLWPILLVTGIIFFLILIKLHQQYAQKADYFSKGIQCLQDEIKFLETGNANFEAGSEFNLTAHPYTYDLDIFGAHSLFQYINRTTQVEGKFKLATMLSDHVSKEEIINNREAIRELAVKAEWRLKFTATGMQQRDCIEEYEKLKTWSLQPTRTFGLFKRIIIYLFPALFITCFALSFFSTMPAYGAFAKLLFFVNLLLLSLHAKSILKEIAASGKAVKSILNYSRLVLLIEEENFESSKLVKMQDKINLSGKRSSVLIKDFANILSQNESIQNVLGTIIFNGMFLYHLHAYSKLLKLKKSYASQIGEILDIVGEIEALNSLANLAYNNPDFAYPELNDEEEISFQNLGHPLIHKYKRICSDVTFKENPFIILTGSNMSGKSTFLRALGVNMILAGIGAPVCATACQYTPLHLFTCMRMNDSLADNESYFFAELKRLKEMITYLKNHGRCFILLDEILRGTNSDDKQTGTIKLIEQIIEYKGMGIIATHDLEVCSLTNNYSDYLENSCFEVEIKDNKLNFDYKLRPGICKNKSASFLMKQMEII